MTRTGRHRPRGTHQRAHDHARPSSSPPRALGPALRAPCRAQWGAGSRLPAAPKQSSRPEGRIRAAAQPGCQQARPLSNPLGQLPLVPRGPKKTHSRSNTQAEQRAAQQTEEGLLWHWVNRACSTLPIQYICEACPFICQALHLQ